MATSGLVVSVAALALTSNPLPAPAETQETTSAAELPDLPARAPAEVEPAASTLGTYADYAQTTSEIPDAALVAYQRAASVMAKATPECHLEWSVLAAIGRVASNHGGSSVVPAMAPDPGRRALPDTDGGQLDGDARRDLPVGPMQLLPATWTVVAVDGDDDGSRDATDLDDAALAAGVVLCGNDRDLEDQSDFREALAMFNSAPRYPAIVARLAAEYEEQLGTDLDPDTLLAAPPPPVAPSTSTTTATEHSQSPTATTSTEPSRTITTSPNGPKDPNGDDDVVTSHPSPDGPTRSPSGSPTGSPDESPSETPTDCASPDDTSTSDEGEEPSPTASLPPCTSSATSPTTPSTSSTDGADE